MELSMLAWAPDSRRLLFCTTAGKCHVIDAGGNPVSQLPLRCKAGAQQSHLTVLGVLLGGALQTCMMWAAVISGHSQR